MTDDSNQETAVALLQELGLKEYESRSFVALSRLPSGTAKDISDLSAVPRTRVYDAVRTLEAKGLVEIQHSNPQQFRAVSIAEASETLRTEYEQRIDTLHSTLTTLDSLRDVQESDTTHEVWALSDSAAIETRMAGLIREANEEVVLVVGEPDVFTDEAATAIEAVRARGVSVSVGTAGESTRETVVSALPDTAVFQSELEWLEPDPRRSDATRVNRLLLVDRSRLLVSTVTPDGSEHAVVGGGFNNGLVTVVRRLLASGQYLGSLTDGAGD